MNYRMMNSLLLRFTAIDGVGILPKNRRERRILLSLIRRGKTRKQVQDEFEKIMRNQ